MRRFFFSDLFYVLGKVEFLLEFEDFQDRRFFEFKKENPCFIAESPALKDLVSILGKISASSSPVLISGEHGTGKSSFAFQIFKKRNIDGGKFFSVDCRDFPNLPDFDFASCDGDVLFMKEISNLSKEGQKSLLLLLRSVLEGKLNLKIVASTCENLASLVRDGGFSEELSARLNVLSVRIPPLKNRKEDIVPLAELFLRKNCEMLSKKIVGFSDAAIDAMKMYGWHGNARELKAVVERASILEVQNAVRLENLFLSRTVPEKDFFKDFSDSCSKGNENGMSFREALASFKRAYIIRVLEENGWNQTKASRFLGLQRTYVSRLMNELKIRDEI